MSLLALTDTNFTEICARTSVLIVDCHATWCAPCRSLKPVLEKLAKEFSATVTIATLDVAAEPVTANAFNVRSVPTLLAFKRGTLQETRTTQLTAAALQHWLRELTAQ